MAEKSYFWACAGIGDGGPDSFSQEAVMAWFGAFGVTFDPDLSGVIPWTDTNTTILPTLGLAAVAPTGELVPTYVTLVSERIRIASGLGMSGGIFYVNTANLDFIIDTEKSGFVNATDRIVLRRSLVDQTVRLTWIQATGIGLTATLQNDATYWDVPIARITLDGSGNYSSLTDDRQYVNSPSSGRVLLHERDAQLDNSLCIMDIANTRYRELELLIELKPDVSNVTIEIYFTPQPTSPVYTKQQLEVSGTTVTASSTSTITAWTWAAITSSQLVLQIRFPMYNTYNERMTSSGIRHGFFSGRGGDGVTPYPYISGSLSHYSSTSTSAILEDLVVDLSGTTYDEGSRISLYGIK